jgi:hypothetical protein
VISIILLVVFHLPRQEPRKIEYRSYKHFDNDNFKKDVDFIPHSACEVFEDPSDTHWFYYTLLTEVLDEHAPLKTKKLKKPQLPYMHSDLCKAMFACKKKRNTYYKYRTTKDWEPFRKQRNLVVSKSCSSVKPYFQKNCQNPQRSKEFYDMIQPFMTDKGRSVTNMITLYDDDAMISKPEVVSEEFNDLFATIADTIGQDDTMPQEIDEISQVYIPSVTQCMDRHRNHSSIVSISSHHQNTIISSLL